MKVLVGGRILFLCLAGSDAGAAASVAASHAVCWTMQERGFPPLCPGAGGSVRLAGRGAFTVLELRFTGFMRNVDLE